MRLLICTQIVDEKDSTLGFFHSWIAALAKNFESIEVVCLQEGEHNLPKNVRVHSLGKENASGTRFLKRVAYSKLLLQYAWTLRREYDTVFVHMNQEYILLAGWLWRLLGKDIYFWRNHYDGSFITDIAAMACKKLFCTSHFSYTAKYKKTKIMPVGVDTSVLDSLPDVVRVPRSILSIGRVASSKNIHLFIEALGLLHKEGVDFTASVYGKTAKWDEEYHESLIERTRSFGMESKVSFHGPLPKTDTYKAYRAHEISVNASPSGMLDKTMFSGMMHGCLILVSNKDLRGQIPKECSFEEGDLDSLAKGMRQLLEMPVNRKQEIQGDLTTFVQEHSLVHLADELTVVLQG